MSKKLHILWVSSDLTLVFPENLFFAHGFPKKIWSRFGWYIILCQYNVTRIGYFQNHESCKNNDLFSLICLIFWVIFHRISWQCTLCFQIIEQNCWDFVISQQSGPVKTGKIKKFNVAGQRCLKNCIFYAYLPTLVWFFLKIFSLHTVFRKNRVPFWRLYNFRSIQCY